MKNKKIILIFLLTITMFVQCIIECDACVPSQAGKICSTAEGEGKKGTGASTEGGHGTDWVGSGINVDINPTSGSGLKGANISFTNDELRELGMNPPTSADNTNLQHAEDWKDAIASIGEVINGDKSATPFQQALLEKLAEENGVNVDEFITKYKDDALKNGSSFDYKDTPYAVVCTTDYSKCGSYTDSATCTAELGDYWGCYGVDIATRACGVKECIGDDGGKLDKREHCRETKSEYECCVEEKGEAECKNNSKPSDPTPPSIESGSCSPTEIKPVKVSPPVLNRKSSVGSIGCGNSYTTYSYEFGSTSCEYVNTLITTTRTEEYPGIYGTYEAGQQFNFSNVVYWYSTRTEAIWDDSPLKNELSAATSVKNSLENQKSCLQKEITNYQAKIAALTCTPGYYSDSCIYNNCTGDKGPDFDFDACKEGCWVPEDCSDKISKTKQYNGEIQKLENQIKSLEPQIAQAQARIDDLNACGARAYSFRNTSYSSSGSYTLSGTYLSLENYKQPINSVKGIVKNSGQLLTQSQLSGFEYPYFENSFSFVIPITTKNGTSGKVVAGNNLYSCPINVTNLFMTDCKSGNCGTGGINVIYRPISLINPFPNIKSNNVYRAMGANWNINFAEIVIKNNRGVSDYEVYNKTPIYTINLDAATIKEIRKYNKTTEFNNFDMQCTDGYLCKSNFLWGTTTNGYDFSKIINQNESCATANGWSACYGGAD